MATPGLAPTWGAGAQRVVERGPERDGLHERRITLAVPARLFTVVRGYASQSNAYIPTIAAEGGAE